MPVSDWRKSFLHFCHFIFAMVCFESYLPVEFCSGSTHPSVQQLQMSLVVATMLFCSRHTNPPPTCHVSHLSGVTCNRSPAIQGIYIIVIHKDYNYNHNKLDVIGWTSVNKLLYKLWTNAYIFTQLAYQVTSNL